MRAENAAMVAYLADHGLPDVKAKWTRHGSLAGCWRLSKPGAKWTPDLTEALTALEFTDFDGYPLTAQSGNGGEFSVCARGHPEIAARSLKRQ